MDVSSGKQTLPLLLAMGDATAEDRATIEKWLANGREVGPILEVIRRYQGVERTLDEARKFADKASASLAALTPADPEAFAHLASLPGYVIGRAF